MILSIDVEKDFDKIQLPFMIRNLNKLRIEGNFLNLTKNIWKKQNKTKTKTKTQKSYVSLLCTPLSSCKLYAP